MCSYVGRKFIIKILVSCLILIVNVSLKFQTLISHICQHFSVEKKSLKYQCSIVFYPITLEGRRGTTDEFATIPFHLDLFSAALVELAKSISVHFAQLGTGSSRE